MRACIIYLCLLVTTFPMSVRSKPHGKHHGLHKTSQAPKEKDVITEEANKQQILPPLVTFDASSQEQDDEELSSEDNTNGNKKDEGGKIEKSTAVLLSEEELVDLLRKEEEEKAAEREQEDEEDEGEDEEEEEEEVKAGKDEVESSEAVEIAGNKETEPEDELETEEDVTEGQGGEEESVEDLLEEEGRNVSKEKKMDEPAENDKHMTLFEDMDGSAESKILVDADYAADSGILQQFHIAKANVKTQADEIQSVPKVAVSEVEEKETVEKPKADQADENQNMQNTEAVGSEGAMDQEKNQPEELSDKKTGSEDIVDPEESKSGTELDSRSQPPGKEEEKSKNDSGSHTKGKSRKQKKNQRARKHSVQRDGTQPEPGVIQQDRPESEDSNTENTVHKAKRRRAGKWGPLVGVNPVQIRATVDLYPRTRPSLGGMIHLSDPCDNFRCKRGKTCKLDANNKPGCVCQDPSECPSSVNLYDHVCGTDNKTYETSCELFATKCNLEGTKKGHRLHLDYIGFCKLIPSCLDTELVQFPLRMRDWLKNVLLQLFEHDSVSPGFLTPKQRFRVKKIFESERRLHAGDHSVELLAQDFEKNYNMYIYPVHWQFAQLDQHPSDRFLSHSELAPLRIPLVPMEHCTSRFFQECDADKDRQVSFEEWTHCFGIKDEDMDVNLLF